MYKTHQTCRACGYGPPPSAIYSKCDDGKQKLLSVLDLGVLPLPNAFRKAGEPRPGHYPIELLVCPRCKLGQLSAVVDPEVLYSNYPYVTSPSHMMQDHFRALWKRVNLERKIETVVEIGSNDGLCLESLVHMGAQRVMGIDPASNLAELAQARGVITLTSVFDRKAADMVSAAMPAIDLVLARHVFCHVDDWEDFIHNLLWLCSRETLVCIEVPYAQNTIDECQWDQIYAEHLSYLTLRSMEYLLDCSPLRLQAVQSFPIHGGAIALFLRRNDSEVKRHDSVQAYLDAERCALSDWERFALVARDQITNLKLLVRDLRDQGKSVVGYGASAKSTMWINCMGLNEKDIGCVYDTTPQKWYTTIPGTKIPVVPHGSFYADKPDYAIVWAWNFLPEILEKETRWRQDGGKFIVPVPEIKML